MVRIKIKVRIYFCFLLFAFFFSSRLFANEKIDKLSRKEVLDSVFLSLEAAISINSDSITKLTKNYISECDSIKYEAGVAKGYYVLGKSNIVGTFNYPVAFDYIYRAQRIFERNSLMNESARCNIQLGLINYLQRNFIEAEDYFVSSMKVFEASGDTVRWRRTAYLASLCASESGKYINAEEYLAIAKKFMYVGTDNSGIREYNYGRGIYFARQNINDSAIYYFNNAFDRFAQKDDLIGTQLFYGEIAQAYFNMGQFEKAHEYADKVIKIGYIHNSVRGFVQSHFLLYKYFLEKRNYKEALVHLKLYVDLKDSMVNERKSFELASIKSKYEIASAEQENILKMAKQTAIQESQVQKQRFLKNLFIVGCFFFIVMIVFLVYTNNLKKRKNAELADSLEKLKSTQEQLIRHEKLASMGKLSAGIAHEIRNPINFITNFSELSEELLTELSESDSIEERNELIAGIKDSMGKIKFHGKRADGIIKSMLDHSRSKSPEKELCNINSLVERNLSMAFNAIRVQNPSFQCKVQNNLAQNLADVKIVTADIGRVLLNIFNNAFQAMDEKKISAGSEYSPLLTITTTSKNGKIILTIRDNGVGIPEQVKDMIFEPFFTTKPSGQGTGLGLSISNEIIKSHNGEMVVDSIQNEFTQFTIVLG